MSPTSRTLAWLRERGYTSQVVEHFNHYAKVRVDLWGIADIISMPQIPANNELGSILLLQVTSTPNLSSRRKKCLQSKFLECWVRNGGTFYLFGWSKKGKRGARKLWTPTIQQLTIRDVLMP